MPCVCLCTASCETNEGWVFVSPTGVVPYGLISFLMVPPQHTGAPLLEEGWLKQGAVHMKWKQCCTACDLKEIQRIAEGFGLERTWKPVQLQPPAVGTSPGCPWPRAFPGMGHPQLLRAASASASLPSG